MRLKVTLPELTPEETMRSAAAFAAYVEDALNNAVHKVHAELDAQLADIGVRGCSACSGSLADHIAVHEPERRSSWIANRSNIRTPCGPAVTLIFPAVGTC